jgi:hypothetical protein
VFDLASKTAVALNIISSCFLFSGGIPLLNIICFASLFLIYWIEKVLITKYYRKPPIYDHKVNSLALEILTLIIILHCAFSAAMFSSVTIWPAEYKQNSDGIIVGKATYMQIMTQTSTISLMLVALLICFSIPIDSYIKNIVNYFYSICMPNFDETTKDLEQTYTQACRAMRQRGICSYSIYANPEYKELVRALDRSAQGGTQIYVEAISSANVENNFLI